MKIINKIINKINSFKNKGKDTRDAKSKFNSNEIF